MSIKFALSSMLLLPALVWADLPSGYEEVAGITSTSSGSQRILTDYVPSSCNITIEAAVTLTKWGTQGIWCSRMGLNDRTMTLFCWNSGSYFRPDRNTSTSIFAYKSAPLAAKTVLKADYKECKFYVDGSASTNLMSSGDFTPAAKLSFFASQTNGSGWGNYAVMTIHYVRIYNEDGTLECELLPVRKTDKVGTKDELGLYDTKSNKYYSSLSSVGFNEYVDVSAEFTEETDAEGNDLLVLTVSRGLYTLTDADRTRITSSNRKFVKRGEGEVIPGSIAEFTGDIVIENGIWQVSATNSLGASNVGSVWVKSGATLKINSGKGATVVGKKLYIEGNGYDASGAIFGSTTTWNTFDKCEFRLTGDSYINEANRLDYYNFFDTCGYNVRFSGPSSSGIGGKYWTNSTERASTVVVNGNQIIVAQGSGNHYRGSSDNRLCLTNSGNYSINWAVSHGWTIEFQNGSKILPQMRLKNTETSAGSFNGPGPVVFSGRVCVGDGVLRSTDTANTTATIAAPMRGSGTLVVDPGWLNLKTIDNTYSGTIAVTGHSDIARAGIRVYDKAKYSAAKTILHNADFEFQSKQSQNLGAMEFSGDRTTFTGASVLGASQPTSISTLIKKDEGALTISGNMAISHADIQSGSLSFPNRYYGHAGLMEGEYVDMSAGDKQGQSIWCGGSDKIEEKIGDDNWVHSAAGAAKIFSGYESPVSNGYRRAKAVAYRGYLWNRNATNETWQFALHMNYRMIMRLNGNWTPWQWSGEESTKSTNVWTTTVKPGANPILIYSLSACWSSTQKPSARFDGLGLSYCRGPADSANPDPAAFAKLDDGGTGYMLTIDDEDGSASADMLPNIAEATFGNSTSMDVGGNEFGIAKVNGLPTINNVSNFTISASWALTDSAVAHGSPLTVDGLLSFDAGTELDIAFNPLTCDEVVSSRLAAGMQIAKASAIIGVPTLSATLQNLGATLTKSDDGETLTLIVPALKSARIEDGKAKVSITTPSSPANEVRVCILRDGQVVAEELLGPGHERSSLDWSSSVPGLYVVVSECFLTNETSGVTSEKGVLNTMLLTSPDVAVRYVATTGNDGNDGSSPTMAKQTVQAAVDSLGDNGGAVYVMPGKYGTTREYNQVVVSNAVSIVGWTSNPAEVVLNKSGSQNSRIVQLANPNACLRMVSVAGGYTWNDDGWPDRDSTYAMAGGANVYIAIEGGTVENCIIRNGTANYWNRAGGNVYMRGGRLANCELGGGGMNDGSSDEWRNVGASLTATGGTIENCWIHGVKPGSSVNNAYVVGLYGSAKMVNCTITDNIGVHCGGILVGSENVRVYDTAIYNNTATSTSATEMADLYVMTKRNYIAAFDPAGAFVNCAATRAINGNCRAVTEPLFTDADNGDYTLTAASPLVDAGLDALVSGRQGLTDLLGEPRVNGKRVDIGCYEYNPPKFETKGMVLIVK